MDKTQEYSGTSPEMPTSQKKTRYSSQNREYASNVMMSPRSIKQNKRKKPEKSRSLASIKALDSIATSTVGYTYNNTSVLATAI